MQQLEQLRHLPVICRQLSRNSIILLLDRIIVLFLVAGFQTFDDPVEILLHDWLVSVLAVVQELIHHRLVVLLESDLALGPDHNEASLGFPHAHIPDLEATLEQLPPMHKLELIEPEPGVLGGDQAFGFVDGPRARYLVLDFGVFDCEYYLQEIVGILHRTCNVGNYYIGCNCITGQYNHNSQ